MKKLHRLFLWFIGILFIFTGAIKLSGLDSMSAALFLRAQYPHELLYIAGLAELIGGLLILIPSLQVYGAIVLSIVMTGAIFTHLILKDHFFHLLVPVGLILFNISLMVKAKNNPSNGSTS